MAVNNKTVGQLMRLSGVGAQTAPKSLPGQTVSNQSGHRKYSPGEYAVLAGRVFVQPKARTTAQNADATQLISYLRPSHEHAVSIVQDVERLRALAPEIGQAENVLVSSIMSPNDLQSGDPKIIINEISGLTETARNEIQDLLYDFFTTEYPLGENLAKWCGEALYRSGSVPVLILPESTLATITGHIDPSAATESLSKVCTPEMYEVLLKKQIHQKVEKSTESFLTLNRKKESDVSPEVVQGAKSHLMNEFDIRDNKRPDLFSGLESITARIVTELEEGDTLRISENPEVLRFGSMVRQYGKNKLGKDFVKLYENVPESQRGRDGANPHRQETIIDLTPYVDDALENKSHPFHLELPAESVIPVCIPGSKTKKLGYYVLIDAFGQPIEASQYLNSMSGCSTSSRIESSYAAMFGSKPTQSGVQTNVFASMNRFGSPWDLQRNAVAKVFDYVLDEMLRKKLKNVGLQDIDLGKYNSIATCMFYRLLENKRTSLVFVPEELITYFAFDYREDGSGKSKLEDIMYVLSVRTTIVISNMMAAMRNSIARKDVKITVDEKETAAESVLDEVRQAFAEKYSLTLSTDPTQIAQAINSQNMTLKLVNGNAALDIDATDTQSQVPKADSDLLDILNSWIVTMLGVPHSVLNELSNAEFARSVATTNLFFAKTIRSYQSVVCTHASKLIQTMIRFSPSLQKSILHVIAGSVKQRTQDIKDDDLDVSANTMNDVDSGKAKDLKQILHKVIQNIEVTLPAPNIAPDKAQNEIFGDYLRLIGEFVDGIYPNELIQNDSELSDTIALMKAHYKRSLIRQFATDSGIGGVFDSPTMEEFLVAEGGEINKFYAQMRNLKAGIDKTKTVLTTPDTSDSEEGGDTSDTGETSDGGEGSSDYTGSWSGF